jgi:hypothetical protein
VNHIRHSVLQRPLGRHLEGDTLVIDTGGFNEKTFIDATGAPHTD